MTHNIVEIVARDDTHILENAIHQNNINSIVHAIQEVTDLGNAVLTKIG